MKKFLSVLLATALIVTMSACGKEDDTSKTTADAEKGAPTIAYICKDLSQEWFVGTSASMKETVEGLGAKKFLTFDCAMSPDKYITALDTVISQKVDVLIVCPPDQNLSQVTVDRCKEAGIKLMADDDGLINQDGKHIAPALELSAYEVGKGIGEYLSNYIASQNITDYSKVGYMVMTMAEVSSCVPRSTGARDAFEAAVPDFPKDNIFEADYDGTSDKGFNVVAATITANPGIKTWYVTAPNDEGAQGATRALEQAGVDKNAFVIGVGGYLAKDEFKKEYSCFKATAYIDPILDGQIAGKAAMEWANDDSKVAYSEYIEEGGTYGIYPFSATLVDASNYEEIMGDAAN